MGDWIMALYYYNLTEAELLAMTESELNAMGEIYRESELPQPWVEIIMASLRTSGPWADYQCDLDRYNRLYRAFAGGLIDAANCPSQPQIEDYSGHLETEGTRCDYDWRDDDE